MNKTHKITRLQQIARKIRLESIRMIHAAGSGHPGGSLSEAEILTALYFHIMNIQPQEPNYLHRDRFILSKGHACAGYYAALALRGYFPIEQLKTFRRFGSCLQGHPDMKKTKGVDMISGPLGNGLGAGLGMALGARIQNLGFRVYVLLGEGDLQEGCTWEAALAAGHHKLNHLIAIVDYNHSQVDGCSDNILSLEPLADKWHALNWAVTTVDGHNLYELIEAFNWALAQKEKPSVIIANTIKGKGVSFMENNAHWHGKAPNLAEAKAALQELGEEMLYD